MRAAVSHGGALERRKDFGIFLLVFAAIIALWIFAALTSAGTSLTWPSFGTVETITSSPKTAFKPEIPVPTSLTATAGNSAITLTWNQSNPGNVAGYLLYRWEYGKFSPPLEVYKELPAGTLNFQDTGLVNGTTYFYALYAEGSDGRLSKITQIWSSPIAPPPPPPVMAEESSGSGTYYSGSGSGEESSSGYCECGRPLPCPMHTYIPGTPIVVAPPGSSGPPGPITPH